MNMKKIGLLMMVGMMALFLSACGESEKEEIISLHDDFHDLTEDVEDEMEETEDMFNGVTDESEFDDMKDEISDYISDKKSELDKIDKPKKDKAIEYYDKSKKALTGAFDMIETMVDIPDLTDEEALMEYSEDIEEKGEEVESDMQDVEDFQDELKDEDDDYKDAFED